jgi:hypothetical protein
MQGDITRLTKWGKIFEDPKKLMEVVASNVLKNDIAIVSDANKIGTDFSAEQYKSVGLDIADIMSLALGPIPE